MTTPEKQVRPPVKISKKISPASVEMSAPSIPVATLLDEVVKNPDTIVSIPVTDIESVLTARDDLFEITWRTNDSETCRAYIDVDGTMAPETDVADFEAMDDTIKSTLTALNLGSPFSLMTASKWGNKDWKDKTVKHKLSYRLTFTHKAGSKDAVKKWTQDTIAPQIKTALAGVIPFYIKGRDAIPADATDYLDWDNAVYRSHGKMRCWNSTKPGEGRKNVLLKGTVQDTLINFIPEDCEILPNPVARLPRVTEPTVAPLAPVEYAVRLTGDKALIASVITALPAKVLTDYNAWLSVGMACYNEEIPCSLWEKWTDESGGKTYKSGDKRNCASKWRTFKRGNITQAYLWSLLKREDPVKFKELVSQRSDFLRLVMNPTHFSVAEYFYNLRPNDYLYDTNSGWFGVLPNNTWENPKGKSHPPTLKNKIARLLNFERLALEQQIVKKKMETQADESLSEEERKERMKTLDAQTSCCLAFRNQIESDGFQKGCISFLSSFYAEQAQMLLMEKGVKDGDGVLAVFDTNPYLFAFNDGLYDFSSKSWRDIHPTDYIMITTGYARPKPNPAVRDEMMKTLTGIWEDTEPRDYMLRLLASCLCGVRNMEVFTILTGRGGNGKGVLWEVVQRTFGGYYYQLPKQALTKAIDSATAATPDIALMRGMRCVGTSEPEADERLQEGTVKLLTGGDPLTARMLYGQPITFKPQCGVFIQANNIPTFNQITKGGVRRTIVMPFPLNFVAEPVLSYERVGNPSVKNVLCRSDEWRDEFFFILMDYYPSVEGKQIDAIPKPKIVTERTAEYLEDNNRVGVWWRENYEMTMESENHFVLSREVLEHFKEDTKIRMSEREFKAALAFNDIDIIKNNSTKLVGDGMSGDALKGRMGILGWRRKTETAAE